MLKLPGIRIYTAKEIAALHTTLSFNLIRAMQENNWTEKPDWLRKIIREVAAKLH